MFALRIGDGQWGMQCMIDDDDTARTYGVVGMLHAVLSTSTD